MEVYMLLLQGVYLIWMRLCGMDRNWPGHAHERGDDVDPELRNRNLRDCKTYDPVSMHLIPHCMPLCWQVWLCNSLDLDGTYGDAIQAVFDAAFVVCCQRFRPWYVAASSGPKDVVLLIDTSGLGTSGFKTLVFSAVTCVAISFSVNDWNKQLLLDGIRIVDNMVRDTEVPCRISTRVGIGKTASLKTLISSCGMAKSATPHPRENWSVLLCGNADWSMVLRGLWMKDTTGTHWYHIFSIVDAPWTLSMGQVIEPSLVNGFFDAWVVCLRSKMAYTRALNDLIKADNLEYWAGCMAVPSIWMYLDSSHCPHCPANYQLYNLQKDCIQHWNSNWMECLQPT